MKKVLFTLMCIAAMMAAGTCLKAQEVTITLYPGWTWISYPNAEVLDINTALGDFVPMEGDVIKSQFSNSTYIRGSWRGGVTHFMPGWGYKYYSNRSEIVSFVFGEEAPRLTVTTAEPTEITANSAVSGGSITSNDGNYIYVFMKGICWATHPNPMVMNDFYTENGSGAESYTAEMTDLVVNTEYYVRAYAVTLDGTFYGDELSFTTLDDGNNDHEYVDLGLPSGLLWATCNVGADNPEDYGDYFAWGETQPKDTYNWSTYQYCMGNYNTLTKYCNNSSYGYNGFTDNLTTLLPEDDAATANWGEDWRMPTQVEWQELLDNTTMIWTTQNGVNGMLFTASNGNSLFLPAAGFCGESGLYEAGSFGNYWSSSLSIHYPSYAWFFRIYSGGCDLYSFYYRYCGQSVRAVRSTSQNTSFNIDATVSPSEGGTVTGTGNYAEGSTCTLTATANEGYTFVNWTENGEVVSTNATYSFTVEADRTLVANFAVSGGDHAYVDLGLPSGLLWATCNVGANSPEDYGDYFAWGETQPKSIYNWSTYQYCMGSENTLTKYCNNSSYGYNGFTDNLTTLLPEDDAATANWGSDWRMPTKEEWQELYQNTTHTWTTQNGVNGRLFTASNGNSLFLPAAGYRYDSNLNNAGSYGYYWSSSLYSGYPNVAWGFGFDSSYAGVYYGTYRSNGRSVRAVRSARQN